MRVEAYNIDTAERVGVFDIVVHESHYMRGVYHAFSTLLGSAASSLGELDAVDRLLAARGYAR